MSLILSKNAGTSAGANGNASTTVGLGTTSTANSGVNPGTSPNGGALPGDVVLRDVGIRFGAGATSVQAVEGINLAVRGGEFVSILGPSGCGKSTLIGALAGFMTPSSGSLYVDGKPVTKPGADRGVVFQYHNLFPWKTVAGNVEFGLKMRGVDKQQRRKVTADILERVGLAEFSRHYPFQLSGGMQQRVSLARVLVNRPRLLLMDEPFSALDAQCRLLMQELLLELWREFQTTVVFVTHDIDEAIFLADRIVLISARPGRISSEISVAIPRPRSAENLTSPEFLAIKRHCFAHLRGKPAEHPTPGENSKVRSLAELSTTTTTTSTSPAQSQLLRELEAAVES